MSKGMYSFAVMIIMEQFVLAISILILFLRFGKTKGFVKLVKTF